MTGRTNAPVEPWLLSERSSCASLISIASKRGGSVASAVATHFLVGRAREVYLLSARNRALQQRLEELENLASLGAHAFE